MDDAALFEDNVKRWDIFSPEISTQLLTLHCQSTAFSNNRNGQLNLTIKSEAKTSFLHSQEDALAEARSWFNALDLQKVSVLFVYGIGLGYAYEAAQDWLKKNEQRQLIFIEDNLEIIHRFFETERASRFLHDKQVWLEYTDTASYVDPNFAKVTIPICFQPFRISASPYYAEHFQEKFDQLHAKVSFWMSLNAGIQSEYVSYGQPFFNNFYKNLLDLPSAYRGGNLYGKFIGVPAIICGAGPSLSKNLAILETLADRALIFAGATALNAVNAHGFVPHFGVGIDPNPAQATRLIANKAYEVPFLYRSRMNSEAFKSIHGDKVLMPGTGGYPISEWFEKELGISGIVISEGFNVVNFSLSIALTMGCNPIILVGVDLAYSDDHSYYSGVVSHPTHIYRQDFKTKGPSEELLVMNDIYGKPVHTVWKWVAESKWYSHFAECAPQILMINATEGGIGMQSIRNKPLKEVVHYLLQRQYDLRVRVHGEIQNSQMPESVTGERIEQLMRQMQHSIEKCDQIFQELQSKLTSYGFQLLSSSDKAPSEEEAINEKEKMGSIDDELAYKYILKDFNESYSAGTFFQKIQLDHDTTGSKTAIKEKLLSLKIQRYKYLHETADINQGSIKSIIEEYRSRPIVKSDSKSDQVRSAYAGNEKYQYDTKGFTIIDPELGISFQEQYRSEPYFDGSGREVLTYPSGSNKIEQFYQDNRLHGPVAFYSEDGKTLARSWWVHGVQQGKALFYYLSGALHSIRRYKDGLCQGKQEYFYKDGTLKSVLGYDHGKLDGDVLLYHPNGKLKRELHFSKGLRQGKEKMWDETGLPVFEVEYLDDHPHGTAKTWYKDGQLSLEIFYDAHGKSIMVHRWDQNGLLISEEQAEHYDFFDQVASQADLLTKSLDTVCDRLQNITPFLVPSTNEKDDAAAKIKKDFQALKGSLEHLHEISEHLLFETGLTGENPSEPIWKSPAAQEEMEKRLEHMTQKLQKDIQSIQKMLGQKPPETGPQKSEDRKE